MAAASRAAQAQIAEEVDPLAEAEIYLAYGRDNQAEEILREALQSSSRKPEIQLKLLEIYAKRKDIAAFDAVARDLHTSTGGKGDLWQQAARLGYQLDPANARYIAGKPTGAEAAAAAAAAAAAVDKTLDFQVDALEPNPEIGTLTDIDAGFGRRFATANANAVNTRVDLNVSIDDGQAAGTQTDIDLGHLDSPSGPTALDHDLDSHGSSAQRAASNTEFDLGTFSGGDTTQIAPMDFRLDTPDDNETQTHSEFEKADSVDFDFKLDETETGTIGLHGEDGSDFDIDEISLGSGPTGKSEPVLDLGQSGPAIPEIDLSGISLDLGGDSGTATEGGPREDHWYDVQTKFDLAKAYQEMGDKEGAREILREVMAEGDATQKAAAEKVLQALS
jgi:pilus assembly protein FimV